jgi:hypothetical protein
LYGDYIFLCWRSCFLTACATSKVTELYTRCSSASVNAIPLIASPLQDLKVHARRKDKIISFIDAL